MFYFHPGSLGKMNPFWLPSRKLTYPSQMAYLKMIFLFPRWDMWIPWRVIFFDWVGSTTNEMFHHPTRKKTFAQILVLNSSIEIIFPVAAPWRWLFPKDGEQWNGAVLTTWILFKKNGIPGICMFFLRVIFCRLFYLMFTPRIGGRWTHFDPFWLFVQRGWFSHCLLVLVRFQEGKVGFCLSIYSSSIDHPTQVVVEED